MADIFNAEEDGAEIDEPEVKKVAALVRHARAKKASDSSHQADKMRSLASIGWRSAIATRDQLAFDLYDRVATAEATRAIETAEAVFGRPRSTFSVIPEISIADPETGGDAAILDAMYEKLGSTVPRVWLNNNPEVIERFAETAGMALLAFITKNADENETLGISGHSVYLPLAAWWIVRTTNPEAEAMANSLLDCALPEAEAIVLTMEDGKVMRVELPA